MYKKSSLCNADTPQCVEVELDSEIGARVRDSKDPDGAVLSFTREEWLTFVAGVKNGDFDLAPEFDAVPA